MGRDTWTGIDAEQERPVCAARTSGCGVSYKPKVKSSAAQRESEGIVVPEKASRRCWREGSLRWEGRRLEVSARAWT